MNSLSMVFKTALEDKAHQIQELKYKAENLKSYYQEERNATANRFADEINSLNANSYGMLYHFLLYRKTQQCAFM